MAVAIIGIDDAADVAQDVLVTAWRKRSQLRDPERERAWLGRIVVNACLDRRRAAGRRLRTIPIEAAGESALPSTSEPSAPGFDPTLDLAIRGLPIEQRAVIALHYAADLPLADVAEALGLPLGTAKSRLASALSKLRQALDTR
jgi:RNA polymerase sigma-70 factor (ECF subfamily)